MNREVDSLTIKVAGRGDEYITVDSFLEIVREAVGILRGLDTGGTLVWKLKGASLDAPLSITFVAQPRPEAEEWKSDSSREYINLFRLLDSGNESEGIPDKLMLRARNLVNVLNNGVSRLTFSAPNELPFTPTQRVQATVDELVGRRREVYNDRATLEGDLKTVSVAGGGTKFVVFDRVTGHHIVCAIRHDDLERAKAALGRRVTVTGKTRYKSGRPVYVEVETFDILPENDKRPSFAEIRGLYRGDVQDSLAQVRSLRDAW